MLRLIVRVDRTCIAARSARYRARLVNEKLEDYFHASIIL